MSDAAQGGNAEHDPLNQFSGAHADILGRFERLGELPGMLAAGRAADAQALAADIEKFFREAVLGHHEDEEKELFREMKRAARAGDEAGLVDSLIARLVSEHRALEGLWKRIEGDMHRLAKGKPAQLDTAAVSELSAGYLAHARFEETVVLPLAAKMLSLGDKAALDLSLHLRHKVGGIAGYI